MTMSDHSPYASPEVQVRSAVPTFLVDDVGATARWYDENLGFRTLGHFPEGEPWAYASLQRGGAEIMLLGLAGYRKPDLTGRRPEGSWDAYIRMDGVGALYRTVEGREFIQTPLVKRPYGDWEFEVRDPNGYVVVFGGDAGSPAS
jgi:catechol 2,3-dioxygenase-like lactoylglutathione lyase family enzyme